MDGHTTRRAARQGKGEDLLLLLLLLLGGGGGRVSWCWKCHGAHRDNDAGGVVIHDAHCHVCHCSSGVRKVEPGHSVGDVELVIRKTFSGALIEGVREGLVEHQRVERRSYKLVYEYLCVCVCVCVCVHVSTCACGLVR